MDIYSMKIAQLSCSLHSMRMEIVRNSYGVRSDADGDCTVTVRSSSSLCVRVPKVYNFTFLPVLSVEMTPKISDDKGNKFKKKIRPWRGSLSIKVSAGICGPYTCICVCYLPASLFRRH